MGDSKINRDGLKILDIQEQDRQRIARDLHDSSLQNLTHLIHKLELCNRYIDIDPIKAKLELSAANKVLKQTISEIRDTIFDLRPMTFDDLGFKISVEKLLYSIMKEKDYTIYSDIDEVSCETSIILVSIYKNIQEAINNILKHAEADEIHVLCKQKGDLCVVEIIDNGIGFNIDNYEKDKHFGLSLIIESVKLLNGKINITSEINKGTKIHFEVSLVGGVL